MHNVNLDRNSLVIALSAGSDKFCPSSGKFSIDGVTIAFGWSDWPARVSFTDHLPPRSAPPKSLQSLPKMVKGRQGERVRLYVRGSILGYKRSKSNQYPNTSLIQIEGVNTKEEGTWYQGKRMAYIYKAKTKKKGTHYRCIWGKVIRPHGNSGVVRAKFKSNLPPRSMVESEERLLGGAAKF
ncbi:hypothetical protein Droror1_Dr00016439 [Drosera rotundifolia]